MKIFLSLYFISSHEVQRSAIPSLKKYINAKNLDVSKLYQVYHIFSKNGWRELCIKHFTNDFIFLDFVGFIRKSSDGLYRGIYLSFSWGKTMILKKGGGMTWCRTKPGWKPGAGGCSAGGPFTCSVSALFSWLFLMGIQST